MMPRLTHVTVATHNFMEAIGVKEFTWFQENVKEFTHYPPGDLPHWVIMRLTVAGYMVCMSVHVLNGCHMKLHW